MSYSLVNVGTTGAPVSYEVRNGLIRAADGRLWAIRVSSDGRYHYAQYSDDDGSTWSSTETVWDSGATGTHRALRTAMGSDGQPAVAIIDGTTARFFHRSGGTWSTLTTVSVSGGDIGCDLFCSSAGNWYFAWGDLNTSKDSFHVVKSANGMTSFGSAVKVDMGTPSSFHKIYEHGASDFVFDGTYIYAAGASLTGSNTYELRTAAYNTGDDTWSATSQIYDTGGSTSIHHPAILYLGIDSAGKLHLLAHFRDPSSFTTIYQSWYFTNEGGSWSSGAYPYGSAKSVHAFCALVISGDEPFALGQLTGYGTNTTKKNLQEFDGGNSWARTAITDTAHDYAFEGSLDEYHLSYGLLTASAVLLARRDDGNHDFHISSSAAFGSASFEKTISQTALGRQTLSPPLFTLREMSDAAVTVCAGGRQIIRTLAGVIWMFYFDTTVRAAYSADTVNWTITAPGVAVTPDGIAACVDENDEPVLAISAGGNLYIYQWSSGWNHRSTLAIQSESFQILYDTEYTLIYAEDEYIKYRTSSDLLTWEDSVTMRTGDSGAPSPELNRRLAANVVSGEINVWYSIRVSGKNTLYHDIIGGASEVVHEGTGGDNLGDFHTGLSIAGTHYAYLYGGDLLVDGSVLVETDSHPALSLNVSDCVVCWGGDALYYYTRGVTSALTATARDGVHTVHGPNEGSGHIFSRGVAGCMAGSEEFFKSTDLIAGDEAFLTNTAYGHSWLSTQNRVITQTAQGTSTLDIQRALEIIQRAQGENRLNRTFELTFTQQAAGLQWLGGWSSPDEVIIQFALASSELIGVKDPTKPISQVAVGVSTLSIVKELVISAVARGISLLTARGTKKRTISQTAEGTSSVGLNFIVQKPISQTAQGTSSLIAVKPVGFCVNDYVPLRPLPSDPKTVEFVYFIGPVPELTLSLQVKKPEYGNVRNKMLQTQVNRTKGGELKVYTRQPTYYPQDMAFEMLALKKLMEAGEFFEATKGRKIYYIDENEWMWIGYITSSNIPLSEEGTEPGGAMQLVFEGKLV